MARKPATRRRAPERESLFLARLSQLCTARYHWPERAEVEIVNNPRKKRRHDPITTNHGMGFHQPGNFTEVRSGLACFLYIEAAKGARDRARPPVSDRNAVDLYNRQHEGRRGGHERLSCGKSFGDGERPLLKANPPQGGELEHGAARHAGQDVMPERLRAHHALRIENEG